MSEHRPEDRLIEQILQTLCGAQCDDPEGGAAQMAESFVRFMDEMPGGFLIYRAGQGEEIIYSQPGAAAHLPVRHHGGVHGPHRRLFPGAGPPGGPGAGGG